MSTHEGPWPTGTPCWVDLSTSDPAAARDFYAEVFGWQLEIGPAETEGYATARLGGRRVCGISGMPAPEGHPPVWVTYLATDDADHTAQAVEKAGGRIFMAPMDVLDFGRMALVQGPDNGFFGLWQSGTNQGVEVTSEVGTFNWNEYMSRDYDAGKDFYAEVFGYTYTELGDGGFQYSTIELDGRTVGGIGTLPAEVPDHIPPHWRVYFAVDDADATVATVQRLGGSVLRPAADMPYGRHADVADPQGGMFVVIKPVDPSAQ